MPLAGRTGGSLGGSTTNAVGLSRADIVGLERATVASTFGAVAETVTTSIGVCVVVVVPLAVGRVTRTTSSVYVTV